MIDNVLGGVKKGYTLKLRNGTKFRVRGGVNGDLGVINEIIRFKRYPFSYDLLPSAPVIVDVGAHIGVFSVHAAHTFRNALVYSYEPFFENFCYLKRNIGLNDLNDRVQPFNCAIGGGRGKGTLMISSKNTGRHRMVKENSAGDVRSQFIKYISISDVFEDNNLRRIDVLKLDCEGCEYSVLFSIPEEYWSRIRTLQMEYHLLDGKSQKDLQELIGHLSAQGFTLEVSEENSVTGYLRGTKTEFKV